MSDIEEKQFEESGAADTGVEDVIPESQLCVSDIEGPAVEPETAAAGEVEESQIQDVADTEPVLPMSELQSSCDTYMSQQNDSEEVHDDLEEDEHQEVAAEMDKSAETDKSTETDKSVEINKSVETDKIDETDKSAETDKIDETDKSAETDKIDETDKSVEIDKSAETSAINSSLEVETNDSLHNISLPGAQLPEEQNTSSAQAQDVSQGDVLEESMELGDTTPKKLPMRKRKERSDDSSPSPKKFKQEGAPVFETSEDKSTSEEKSSFEVYEDSGTKQEEGQVVNISSTPEKTIIINDSQEFSLRIDETSPPQVSEEKMKDSQESYTWKSHEHEKMSSPSQSYLSQKSASSWTSHKDHEDKYQTRDKLIEDFKKEIMDLKKENEDLIKKLARLKRGSISPETKKSHAVGEGKTRTVTDERLTSSLIQWTIDEKTNKVLAAELKQISVLEELQGDKPGRYSITSSISTKTSSSGGSVGLPGPFPLPGYTHRTRLSVMSSVSTSTSGSSNTKPGWDGPFLKPLLPAGKTAVTITCGCCGFLYPPVDKVSSPIMNGSPKLSEEEEVEVKSLSPKRSKKVSLSSAGASSGPLEEETSSSSLTGSQPQPQAASTPTPSKGRGRGRRNGSVQRTPKNGVAKLVKTKSSLPLTPIPSEPSTKREAVLARWGRDGCYYPGWVSPTPTPGPQTLVQFCDGQSKLTPMSRMVRADIVTPGTLVLTTTATGEYEEALVIKVDKEGPEPMFHVERDNVTREVEFASIALLEAQVSELTMTDAQKAAAVINFNDLSLENIISHPRKRAVRSNFADIARGSPGRKKRRQTTPEPSTSHGHTFNGPDEYYMDTDSSTHSSCSLDLRGKEVKPLDVECSPPEVAKNESLKLSHYRRKNTKSKDKKEEPGHLVEAMGPIPEPGSELFKDCVFLVTYTNQVEIRTVESSYSGDESGLPVWKERLRTQIKNGGGKVYASLNQVSKEELERTYLVTDKPSNTPLYLQCLVNNIPIYSIAVVKQCCTQNLSWKDAISQRGTKKLSAGYSLAKKCMVNPRSTQPLRGKTILMALSGDPSLTAFWENLATKVGGTCETYRGGCLQRDKFDMVVTDPGCDQDLVVQACEQKLPLVSVMWLQQCIVTGECRSPTESPLYKYNSEEGQDSPEY